ncbi:FAD-dependent oxidoreductase [Micromonospora sp. Llam7]|uniref:FAD-dependent oxidoreductase n=1 Tax=Micromonospora tarapacensis TaxID=2835305 RepID=UPI001C8284B7|nr:FAD-dependent oxidoreductase [Micromonospora tarapacensis]MBX7264961.1 FAD-dependent oxidoreductase [Micromonospora tarapacensis]
MALSKLFGRLIGVRPHEVDPGGVGAPRVPRPVSAVVVGGGIAGMSAAVVLAERGVEVTVLEASPALGGRLGAWPETLADGTRLTNEHGFHAFFRQYYNWRNILRRIDPALGFLRAVPGYPVLSAQWPTEEFGRLPPAPPANLLTLLARSPSLRLRDLRGMDRDAALPLLAYDPVGTYADFDHATADGLLTSLRLPDRARAMLFEVFSHSFFNHEAEMSAAEMIAQFHFYLLGNPEGLAFDCPDEDYATAIWAPLARHVERHGGQVRTGVPATAVHHDSTGWQVQTPDGVHQAGHVVLAVDPPALAALVADSPSLAREAPALAAAMPAYGRPGPPYAVARYWCDGDVDPGRAIFSGVSRQSTLDSVTLYHRLERESRRWAERGGGSVIELHAYACAAGVPAVELAERMRTELATLWPEVDRLRVRELRARVEAKAPAFAPGGHAGRPRVRTEAGGLYLAGDGIRTDFPGALMERAAATGIVAANHILRAEGGAAEPVHSVRPRGLLARRGPA